MSGTATVGTNPSGDNVSADGTQAFGRVSTWKDGYTYAGDITSFTAATPSAIEVLLGDGTVLSGEEAIARFNG